MCNISFTIEQTNKNNKEKIGKFDNKKCLIPY